MGRYPYSDRLTVEACKSVSISYLKKEGYLDGGIWKVAMDWSRRGKPTGGIDMIISTQKDDANIRFLYTHRTRRTPTQPTELDYTVPLVSTPCHFGGLRWWMRCPIEINGHLCNRRVAVLYLARGPYFGCRICHNLTYESSQESHKFDRLFRQLGITPQQAKYIFERN